MRILRCKGTKDNGCPQFSLKLSYTWAKYLLVRGALPEALQGRKKAHRLTLHAKPLYIRRIGWRRRKHRRILESRGIIWYMIPNITHPSENNSLPDTPGICLICIIHRRVIILDRMTVQVRPCHRLASLPPGGTRKFTTFVLTENTGPRSFLIGESPALALRAREGDNER